MKGKIQRKEIEEIAAPIARDMGLEVWGIETGAAGKRPLIRIYLDSPSGVGVDQCAEFSRNIGVILDVEEVVPGSHILEVSSPGLERPFFRPEQLAGYIGREISLQLSEPREGRKNWRGTLVSAEDDSLRLLVDGTPVEFHWNEIRKSRLVYTGE